MTDTVGILTYKGITIDFRAIDHDGQCHYVVRKYTKKDNDISMIKVTKPLTCYYEGSAAFENWCDDLLGGDLK